MINFFASHKTAANLLMGIFFVLGALSIGNLQRETFPRFETEKVKISVSYAGATAEEIENSITSKIEEALNGINYLEEVTSISIEGSSSVTAEMSENGNIQTFMDDIQSAVDRITTFPDNAKDPVIAQKSRTDHVVAVAVSGKMSLTDLKEYTEQLKFKMQQNPGIPIAAVLGFSDHQLRVNIKAERLNQLGLSISDVATSIASQSINLPLGSIKSSEQEILLKFSDERTTIEGLEDIIVKGAASGAEVKLGDLATFEDRFDLDEEKIIFNGERAAFLSISKSREDDTLKVYDAVNDFLKRERKLNPHVKLTLTYDMSSMVRDRLSLLATNACQGLLLVFFSLWLFFSFRLSFWVSMGLPVSFMGTFFIMRYTGYTINMISMVGLILALGLLMDDAIVIAENIATHLRKGKSSLEAAVEGLKEVQGGVIMSFLTTACVFLPLATIEGRMGKVLSVIPAVLLMVLAVSLVEAFYILPSHLSHSLEGHQSDKPNKFRAKVENYVDFIRYSVFAKLVTKAIKWRYLTIGLILMTLVIAFGTVKGGILKFNAFPSPEGDSVEARILLPQGTPLERTEEICAKLIKSLKEIDKEFTPKQPEKQNLIENTRIYYSSNSDATESGAHLATVYVDLLDNNLRTVNIENFIEIWREKTGSVSDVISLKYTEDKRGPAGTAIKLKLSGDNLGELDLVSNKIMTWFNKLNGVHNLMSDLRPGKPELELKLKKGASLVGLDAQKIARQVRAAFNGITAAEIQVGRESYDIDVRLAPEDKNSQSDLENFKIISPSEKQIPLKEITNIQMARGYSAISRLNGLRTVTITGEINHALANTSEVIQQFSEELLPKIKRDYPGIKIRIHGEARRTQKTGSSMGQAFLLGVIGIFFILSFQFGSYSEPLIIMAAIPFAMIGVIFGHIFMGLELTLPSILGFISLSGIVVNDSILLVEFVKRRHKEGMTMAEAAVAGSTQRFRAVMLTSVTTIAGLIPLLTETSRQAQFLIPIAVSLVFGLMASTVMVLIVIPAMYTIIGDFKGENKKYAKDELGITQI